MPNSCHFLHTRRFSIRGTNWKEPNPMTGMIIVLTPASTSTSIGYGKLQVKFAATADEAYPSTWQVSTSGAGGPWSAPIAVYPANTSFSVEKQIGTYLLKINPPAGHSAGTPKNITIAENKLLPVKIDYQ